MPTFWVYKASRERRKEYPDNWIFAGKFDDLRHAENKAIALCPREDTLYTEPGAREKLARKFFGGFGPRWSAMISTKDIHNKESVDAE